VQRAGNRNIIHLPALDLASTETGDGRRSVSAATRHLPQTCLIPFLLFLVHENANPSVSTCGLEITTGIPFPSAGLGGIRTNYEAGGLFEVFIAGLWFKANSRRTYDSYRAPNCYQNSRHEQPNASIADPCGACQRRQRCEGKEVNQLEVLDEEVHQDSPIWGNPRRGCYALTEILQMNPKPASMFAFPGPLARETRGAGCYQHLG
jgi:hypothetical protein